MFTLLNGMSHPVGKAVQIERILVDYRGWWSGGLLLIV